MADARSERRREITRALALRRRRGWTFVRLGEETGIPSGTLAWWSRRLRLEALESESGSSPAGFVEVSPRLRRELQDEERESALVGGESLETAHVELVLRNGRTLRMAGWVDPQWLRQWIEVAESC